MNCNFIFSCKIRDSVQKWNYRHNLTGWKLQNIWLFPTFQKWKKIIQGVLKIKIRWPLQKYYMIGAFEFHRLNVSRSLMFSLLIQQLSAIWTFSLVSCPFAAAEGALAPLTAYASPGHRASVSFPRRDAVSREGCHRVFHRVKLLLTYPGKL